MASSQNHGEVLYLSVGQIRLSSKAKSKLSRSKVEAFAALFDGGRQFPPIKVLDLGNGSFAVNDGRHRMAAMILAGFPVIPAVITNSPRGSASRGILLCWLFCRDQSLKRRDKCQRLQKLHRYGMGDVGLLPYCHTA